MYDLGTALAAELAHQLAARAQVDSKVFGECGKVVYPMKDCV